MAGLSYRVAIPPVWCLRCARPARFLSTALDPRYVIVECAWRDGKGKPRGCGKVLGTANELVAQETRERRLIAAIRRQHPNHPNQRRYSARCPDCDYTTRHDLHLADFRRAEGCDRCDGITPHDYHVANRQLGQGCPECGAIRQRLQPLGHRV